MKRWFLIFVILLGSLLCFGGCSIPGPNVPEHRTYYPLNRPREIYGSIVTLTNATAVNSYTAPDGTEYTPEPGGKIIVVTADVEKLTPHSWSISTRTYIQHDYYSDGIYPLSCEPIVEVSSNSKMTQTLLFYFQPGEFSGFYEDYTITLYVKSENNEDYRWFTLDGYTSFSPSSHPWRLGDDSFALTEVITANRYLSPDGTEYCAEKTGTLVILKCKAVLTEWRISNETKLRQSSRDDVFLHCDPFIETDENGDTHYILIFRLGKDDDYKDPEMYQLLLCMESEREQRTQTFLLKNN